MTQLSTPSHELSGVPRPRRQALQTLAVAGAVGAAAALVYVPGSPSLVAPLPVYVLILGWFFGPVTILLWPIAFLAWNPSLFTGKPKVPRRSIVMLAVLAPLLVAHLAVGRPYGLRHQGELHTTVVTCANAVFVATLVILAVHARRRPSFHASLVFHGLLFLWLGWYAFPSLGELP